MLRVFLSPQARDYGQGLSERTRASYQRIQPELRFQINTTIAGIISFYGSLQEAQCQAYSFLALVSQRFAYHLSQIITLRHM